MNTSDLKFMFLPYFDTDAHDLLLEETSGVSIVVRVSWLYNDGEGNMIPTERDFVFPIEQLRTVINSHDGTTYGQMFVLILRNVLKVNENNKLGYKYDDFDCAAYVVSETGAEFKAVKN